METTCTAFTVSFRFTTPEREKRALPEQGMRLAPNAVFKSNHIKRDEEMLLILWAPLGVEFLLNQTLSL